MVYKTCLSQFDSHMHEAQVEGQSAEGAYLQCTATTPIETVCKQFVNGSVPFGFSLNSGFDTGNDSWFSRGCLSGRRGGAHTCPETHARRSAGRRARGEGPQVKGHHFLLVLGIKEAKKKKKNPFVGGSEDAGWSGWSPSWCWRLVAADPGGLQQAPLLRKRGHVIQLLHI